MGNEGFRDVELMVNSIDVNVGELDMDEINVVLVDWFFLLVQR